MVQTHVVNTNRKKRNVLSRSKLLLQVLTLRENNKILAKAVAEKALKICELENEGLSFKNIKLESRESIKSLREYVLNLESMVKKAVSELAGVVNRFTSILSSTKIEKQRVEYLSNLITNDNSSSPAEPYNLRGRYIKTQDSHSKSQERKKHRSAIKRVHPMNLRKSVCVLEPLKETNDTSLENILSDKNKSTDQNHILPLIKCEDTELKKEVNADGTCDSCSKEIDLPPINVEVLKKGSDIPPNSGLTVTIKREVSSSKNSSRSDPIYLLENPGKMIKKTRDLVRAITSPRKLRPRKPLNYAEMLNTRPPNSATRHHHSRTVSGDSEDRENKLGKKNPQENQMGKKSTKTKTSTTPLSLQQVKEEPGGTLNFSDTEPDFKCLEDIKVKHVQQTISKMHGNRSSNASKGFSKRSSNNSNNSRKCSDNIIPYGEDDITSGSYKKVLDILHVYDEKKGGSRSDSHHENSEKDHGRLSSTLTLPQIVTEDSISIKQEILSPKK